MKTFRDIWYIAQKDLKIFATDRASVFFFVVFPFMFILLFNFLMSGVGGEDQRLNLHLATREGAGGLSHQILGAMETPDEALLNPGEPYIVWERDYTAARQAVDDGEITGFVSFPADFTAALNAGEANTLEVYANAENVDARAALSGLARAISSQIGSHSIVIQASLSLLLESGALAPQDITPAVQQMMDELFSGGAAGAESLYVTFRTEKVGEVEAENPANWVIPGYLVMFVFFAAAMAAELIVRERLNYTLERLLTTSVKQVSILGGLFTGLIIRGVIQIIIFWTVGILAFNVDLGLSPLAVIILSILMVLMSSSFAVMLATLAKTRRSAGALANLTALILAPLGGCWWPLFLYPDWLQTIARVTPHAWATTGFNKLMVYGADFGAAVPEMLALLVFTVIFAVIAALRFRTSAI